MSRIDSALYEIHQIDELAGRDNRINRIHPLVKLFLTIFYIFLVVSFTQYDLFGLIGMLIYPLVVFSLADLSIKECLYRLRIVLPLICMVGIANIFFTKAKIDLGFAVIPAGYISALTIMMKGVFAVFASYLLIATTTVEKICYALRQLHVPTIMVTQFLLTYRYITLLLNEVNRITQAYSLRAPKQKGVHFKVWGSLTGQLLLRSIDRANAVYESMTLRGYNGEFRYLQAKTSFMKSDFGYLLIWTAVLIILKRYPVVFLVGGLFV